MITISRYLLFATCLVTSAFFVGCDKESEEPSAAEEALEKLQGKYDELIKEKFDDPVQWAADDLENIGDWEYEVVEVSFVSADKLALELNEFGNEKWEVVWMEKSPGGYLVVLKRPSVSYLSRIPLSGLGRLVGGDSDSSQ